MNFLVYKRPEGDIVYINPDNFIRLTKNSNEEMWIKYRHACDNYGTEQIDPQFGIQLVDKISINIKTV